MLTVNQSTIRKVDNRYTLVITAAKREEIIDGEKVW